ncbi:Flp/Fap pilin component [Ammonifex degensii KC4]|uniref:Flp/Fap pilin component n=1 Tax=Ammonifex degensii (strain DSM 10501 / KC4) TaxID=429009 RepID=C9RCD6_AMMDK|nr:Flp family type IVb pilin [Ammonifex degensii]ACX51913.1 Flp/Fap pilin component [Ammonifex degensii KC4]
MLEKVKGALARFVAVLKSEEGQGLSEYGLILALVAIAVILALTALGIVIKNKFKHVAETINNANSTY